jgi:hypothetical protein
MKENWVLRLMSSKGSRAVFGVGVHIQGVWHAAQVCSCAWQQLGG